MKILVDAHIGRLIISFLERLGHSVLQASTFPPKTSDAEILRVAFAQGCIVMTSDKDFGELVFRLLQPAAGIILLRIEVPHETERLVILENYWPQIERSAPGYFVVVTNGAVRRSPLPEPPTAEN